MYYYISDLRINPYEEGANIALAGIAYLIFKSAVYGFIG